MQQFILTCLFGILFLIVSSHGRRLRVVNRDSDSSEGDNDWWISNNTYDLWSSNESDVSWGNWSRRAVGQPLVRRHFSDLKRSFQRRQSSGFTASQRQYQQYALDAHNGYRKRHCASPLQLDDNLSRSAQNYAQYLARINQMVHSGTNGLGENLYMQWSSAGIKTISGKWTYFLKPSYVVTINRSYRFWGDRLLVQ